MNYLFKISVFSLVASLLFSCNSDNVNTKIEGKLKIPMDVPVWIGAMGVESIVGLDSSKTDDQGEFRVHLTIDEPSLYLLTVGPSNIYLVLKPNEDISIEIDNSLNETAYYVEGSTDSRLVQELISRQERVLAEITQISLAYEQSKSEPEAFLEKKAKLDEWYNELLQTHKQYTENLIYTNPESLAAIFALYQNFGRTNQPLFDQFEDFAIFNFVDSSLSAKYPNTPAVQALNKDITDIRAQLKYKNYAEKLIEPGKKAPDFEISSIDNQIIKLSDFESKPVVYFFFATWNEISVEELLRLNEIYKRYRYRGLKVIGVSFDSSEEQLKSFIEENDVLFPVACDYLYWESNYVKQFGIRQIPELIFINPNHIIENKNISTTELNNILTEWRKSNLL